MKKLMFILLIPFFLFGQEDDNFCNHSSFNLGAGNVGIGFGNSQYHSGIRFNISDCDVKNVNGINITFWRPYHNDDFIMNDIEVKDNFLSEYELITLRDQLTTPSFPWYLNKVVSKISDDKNNCYDNFLTIIFKSI